MYFDYKRSTRIKKKACIYIYICKRFSNIFKINEFIKVIFFHRDTYGWDQSDKFVKIYITSLSDISKVKDSDISAKFGLK